MDRSSIVRRYTNAVFDTDREAAMAVVEEALAAGMTPEEVIFEVVVPATSELMSAISRDPDANLAQHFMTAQIAAEITDRMLARFEHPPASRGRVVIGTALGDLHSLGKRIVSGCLKAMMVEVIDLGVNVPAERFVSAAIEHQAQVIAISAMMVHTALGEQGCSRVRSLLEAQPAASRPRLIVGGAPYRFDEGLYRTVGADAWAPDGASASNVIVELLRGVKS